jgi:hypothetical protein
MQSASMQDWVLPQSLAMLHTGAASPGVEQNPRWQTVAPPLQAQQSALLAQALRQAPLTHISPLVEQSLLARQPGCAPWSAVQMPLEQRSVAAQSPSTLQSPWQ